MVSEKKDKEVIKNVDSVDEMNPIKVERKKKDKPGKNLREEKYFTNLFFEQFSLIGSMH